MMDKLISGIIITLGTAASIAFIVCIGTFLGGCTGWIIGIFFEDTFVALKMLLGVTCTDFELGAMLGFVGGFFRTTVTKSE